MAVENESYKLDILEYAVNQSINRLLPKSSQDALNVIRYQSDEVVWRVATDTYTKSGYQIDFIFIRDILNLRIERLQNRIAEEYRIGKDKEAEEARIRAKLEAERLAREAEAERIRKEKETEETRIKAKLKAERLAREVEQKKREEKQREEEKKQLQELKKANPDVDIDNYKEFNTFIRIRDVLADQLEVEKEQINLDTILDKDLDIDRYDSYFGYAADLMETVMAIEEELDVEISNKEQENISSYTVAQLVNFVMQKASLY